MAPTAAPATDEAILDAAEACLRVVGARRTTIEDVATAAGVSRVTIYRRIGNRDEVVLQVLVRITERYLQWLQPRLLAQATFADALAILIRTTTRAARQDDLSLLFASETDGSPGRALPGSMAPLAQIFADVIERLEARLPGALAPGITPLDAGEWVLRVIISLATIEPARPRTARMTDDLARRLVLPGLATT